MRRWPVCASAAGVYHLSQTVRVGGDGGWDYLTVDDTARRVYVSHGIEVDVLDADSYKLAGKIENLQGVHGIALAPDTPGSVSLKRNLPGVFECLSRGT